MATAFFGCIKEQAATAGWLSEEHFTVNGTLIEAWTSLKSFRPRNTPLPSSGGGHNRERIRTKTAGNLRKTRQRGEARVNWMFTFMATAYNMVSIGKPTAAVSP